MKAIVGQLTIAAALGLLPVGIAHSLHQTDHRYDVSGYIIDGNQQPVGGVPVVAHVGGERMGSGRSDSSGYFRFRMHLHDSDLGRELRLKTPDYEGTVRVTLTPGDASTERIHHVNFVDGQLVEGLLPGRGGISYSTIGIVGAAALVICGFLVAEKMRRQRRRRQRAERRSETPRPDNRSRRRKRKRRKRRR